MCGHTVVRFTVKTTCSYTSSDKIMISVLRVTATSCCRSFAENTCPLDYVALMMIMRFGVIPRGPSQFTAKPGTEFDGDRGRPEGETIGA